MDIWNELSDPANSLHQEVLLCVFETFLLTQVAFWSVGGLTILVDVTGKPSWFIKNKIQPGKNQPLKKCVLLKIAKVAVINQFCFGLPLTAMNYVLMKHRGCELTLAIPYWNIALKDLICCVILEEVCFYYSHRLLHHPLFYKSIHKVHHEWTSPIGIAAVYAHPVEYIFSNIVPLMLGPIICGSSLVVVWLWFTVAITFTISHHSGYHIPGVTGNEFHDYHHLKFNENYGVLGVLDWVHGTDIKFRQSRKQKQTFLLTQVAFWSVSGLTILVDVTKKPSWFTKNKIQPGINQPFCFGLPLTALNYVLMKYRGCELTLAIPHWTVALKDLIFCVILEEACFYYSHRLLHRPLFYKSIHKVHHEWTSPIGIAAVYAHPVEYIFSNIVPLMLGPIICGSSLVVVWLWFTVAITFTISHHSGYHIPGITGNEFHDYHLLKFNENYGVLGFLDWVHGTDIKYRQSRKQKRQ